jgi:predicted small lipoprotein YifL
MIAAFVDFFAGIFVLKKSVVFLLTLTALCGCGYKGALYIPDAPVQNSPAEPTTSNTDDTSALDNTVPDAVPASIPGELN